MLSKYFGQSSWTSWACFQCYFLRLCTRNACFILLLVHIDFMSYIKCMCILCKLTCWVITCHMSLSVLCLTSVNCMSKWRHRVSPTIPEFSWFFPTTNYGVKWGVIPVLLREIVRVDPIRRKRVDSISLLKLTYFLSLTIFQTQSSWAWSHSFKDFIQDK